MRMMLVKMLVKSDDIENIQSSCSMSMDSRYTIPRNKLKESALTEYMNTQKMDNEVPRCIHSS